MPYIKQSERVALEAALSAMKERTEEASPGQLNYIITSLLSAWLTKDPTYSGINSAIGILECAKLELYRRVASPYEDKKANDNGEVY